MKCTALLILVLTTLSSVFAATEVGRIKGSYYYRCYDDGTATFTGTTVNSATEYTIPAYVTYEGKNYRVTTVIANVFKGKTRSRISIDKDNTGLLLQKNAFNGILGLKEFNIYSKNVVPEIGAFDNIGKNTKFGGEGLPNAINKLANKYLNKWGLPVRKNYNSISDIERMRDLANLSMNVNQFIYLVSVPNGNTVATALFTRSCDEEGLARLYRVFALAMGYNEKHILVGCDNYHKNLFNYVLINNNSGIRKWHVLNPLRFYPDGITNDMIARSLFEKEKKFIEEIKKNYRGYNFLPEKFMIYNNVYNFEGETGFTGNKAELFNSWLTRVGGGQRTL